MKKRIQFTLLFEKRSDLARLSALTLLLVVLSASLGWRQYAAQAAPAAPMAETVFSAPRNYYLTTIYYNGSQPEGSNGDGAGVCASGYHFASVGELADTSNLKYNHKLGITQADAGGGPPSWYAGWVRTNKYPESGENIWSNCGGWTQSSAGNYGVAMHLPKDWSGMSRIPWRLQATSCDSGRPVWCVADYVGQRVFLPIMIK